MTRGITIEQTMQGLADDSVFDADYQKVDPDDLVSNCCGARVINTVCMDCKEHCEAVL